jgi:hypothetical protein
MQTVRTLGAELRQFQQGCMDMGTKEDESCTGRIWAVGFHYVTALSHLAQILKLINHFLDRTEHFS